MIINEPAIEIIKHNVNIAVYCLKSQTTNHGEFMYVFLDCYLPMQMPLKLLSSSMLDHFYHALIKSQTMRFATFYV